MSGGGVGAERAAEIAAKVESFVRTIVIPYEQDPRRDFYGAPTDDLVQELREKARTAGVLTPHILADGSHLSQRETAMVLRKSGLSPLGPLAVNTNAPDEGNMYLLGKVGSPEIKQKFLQPLVGGRCRSAFFMTEPAADGGAGSDPSMMLTTCRPDGNHWVVNGRKAFITGAMGARVGIVMAKSEDGACMFLVDLPNPAIRIERVINTIDSSMPGGHSVITIEDLRIPADQMLGNSGEGFTYAQVRLSPARLSHCMRWTGAAIRANEIATDYACRRQAFGKTLIDHEGVGFMLAENLIDLKQAELITDWCADVLDGGSLGTAESSMAKVAVSEALMRVADRCVQVMGGTGVSQDTIVEQVFREIRSFRIYDGPTEVHKWSLAKKIKRDWKAAQGEAGMVDNAPALAEIDFEPARLRAWLDDVMPETRGSLDIERIGGGQSNPTYFVTAGASRMVLRKRPPGELPKSAHDVGREYRIISALDGTRVPVPEPILYHEEPDVVGTPFYLMGRIDGRLFQNAALLEVPASERRAYYRELARVLAELHLVDWRSTELASFERPGSFLARQADRWSRAWGADETGDAEVAEVASWLRANVPAEETLAIVHGDYKFTNLLLAPDEAKILGVLDWELCTIGDPLTDLAHIWSFQWQTTLEDYGGIMGEDLDALGLPSFAEFAEDYYSFSQSPRRLTKFHLVLAQFRTAGIFHGIAERAASGSANAGNAEEKGKLDRVYVRRAIETIHGDFDG